MVTPLYVSECAPRAIRGGLTGIYQFFVSNPMGIAITSDQKAEARFLDRHWCDAGILDQLWLKSPWPREGNIRCVYYLRYSKFHTLPL